jgi:uncharacterized protein (TIGR03790 family)
MRTTRLFLLLSGFPCFLVFGALLNGAQLSAANPQEDAAATVVIYNAKDPDSKGLADFYCSARAIDPAHEIALSTTNAEEISRNDYDISIATPLRQELVNRGYWSVTQDMMNRPILIASSIRYAVVIRGIPLKIKECTDYPGDSQSQPAPVGTVNAASIDSEISVLGLFSPQISGVLKNPVCNNASHSVFNPQVPPALLFVARLDAPSVEAVRSMVMNGLHAEKEGLWGWGYIDLRSITSAGYAQGDNWIRASGTAMRRYGIPVISDDLPDTYQSGFPVTDAAAYYGWYSENIDGPFADIFFQFVPGAVAAHLHSFSATTLHDANKGWTGPFIQHGASASVGNVYEPYLAFTTDFGLLCSSLLAGSNLADSYYAAQPVLSWMSILVGDPLYRPYACFAQADSTSASKSVWTDYRRIILSHDGDVLKSAGDLVARAKQGGQSLYLEALGAAQMDAGALPAAEASFAMAFKMAKENPVQFRLLLEDARCFEKQGDAAHGASLLRWGLLHYTTASQRGILLEWIARMDPIKVTPASSTPGPVR